MAMASSLQDIAPAAGGPISTETLNSILARQYYEMAKYENDTAYDYKAAKQYTQKAMMAAEGKVVTPSKVSAFDVPEEKIAELNAVRGQLIAALQTQNTPENQQALAKAQTSFDCWLERAEEAADDAHYAQCQSDFQQAMVMMTAPAAGTPMETGAAYEIKFSANSAIMNEASQKDIEHVANILKAPDNSAYSANVTGFIGAATGEFANQLATARVNAVRSALVDRGVDAARLMGGDIAMSQGASEVRVTLNAAAAAQPNVTTKTEYVPVTPTQVPSNQ
jgi:outer membrane protein OmpA-like peptidoglycan-associated protein